MDKTVFLSSLVLPINDDISAYLQKPEQKELCSHHLPVLPVH